MCCCVQPKGRRCVTGTNILAACSTFRPSCTTVNCVFSRSHDGHRARRYWNHLLHFQKNHLLVCHLQLASVLTAGVSHPDGCAQKPNPPCFLQSLSLPTDLEVHPAIQHSPLPPPPCLQQRPLRREGVVQPAMEHGLLFLPPPWMVQYLDLD